MNGAQDLGGMMGFGSIAPEKDEPYFHAEWEKRALAVTLAAGACGKWNIDASRHARESLNPGWYLTHSYYEIWIAALEKLLLAAGMVSAKEVSAGTALTKPVAITRILKGPDVAAVLAHGTPCRREAEAPQRFKAGDQVRTIAAHIQTHTRLPRYAFGKLGKIESVRGVFVFPDANAHGRGEQPQWCYTVAFEARELWGAAAEPGHSVSIDAFEPYLESA